MPTPPLSPAPTFPTSQAPTYDMFQLNQAALLTAAGVSAQQQTGDYYAQNFKGITVALNVSSFGGASLVVIIEGKDAASGNYFPLLTSGAITSKTTTSHTVYPGLTPGSTADTASTSNNILPSVFRIRVTVAGGTCSFTIGAVLTT